MDFLLITLFRRGSGASQAAMEIQSKLHITARHVTKFIHRQNPVRRGARRVPCHIELFKSSAFQADISFSSNACGSIDHIIAFG
jgi:hypothetical protein